MKIGSVPEALPAARPAAPAKPNAKGGRTFVEVLRAADREVRPRGPASPAPAQAAKPTPKPAPKPANASSPVTQSLTRALDAVNKGEARIDALLEAAAKGKTFSAGELIAMQASVFKYSQTVEVLSRATDKLVGALKQTLGTQV
jgi:predicted component of type VI protein secretion system